MSDLEDTMLDLNEKEELISKCLECQLGLARVVRYLNGEVDGTSNPHLQMLVDELAANVAGVKEHAAFEHDKVRYLQIAVTGIINIKQSEIVKVFTIITAVFLPPTLVATFYGMNFAVMPELSWKHGFTFSRRAMEGRRPRRGARDSRPLDGRRRVIERRHARAIATCSG